MHMESPMRKNCSLCLQNVAGTASILRKKHISIRTSVELFGEIFTSNTTFRLSFHIFMLFFEWATIMYVFFLQGQRGTKKDPDHEKIQKPQILTLFIASTITTNSNFYLFYGKKHKSSSEKPD